MVTVSLHRSTKSVRDLARESPLLTREAGATPCPDGESQSTDASTDCVTGKNHGVG
ncbi:hypothetical protein HPP92_028328 [Vanilla planifolia]|uniref:Uncharacterized protein n=1 Tax=Vanilla planifolia TaxID=51239 RepID=A0A835U645_VANPL|nr:hypothetical protein HPP92_028328 [Vanilla planifolia]KAG0447536.1 hypothetical protein HPP92_028302 [Vanilla planifolia]